MKSRTTNHSGCPFCSGRVVCTHKSLSALVPALAAQWHPTKNADLMPDEVAPKSGKKVWWLCPNETCGCTHEWQATVQSRNRTISNGCPFCCEPPQKICIHRSLSYTLPAIAKSWHPTLNGALKPEDVAVFSGQKVWWLCEHKCVHGCEHAWDAAICDRTGSKNSGCPFCCAAPRRVCKHDSFAALFPELLKEWSAKNVDLDPKALAPHSNVRAWWKCTSVDCTCEWEALISSRTGEEGRGCPTCNANKGEKNVRAALAALPGVLFEEQVTYPNMRYISALRYDFANIRHPKLRRLSAIEADGIFHFLWLIVKDPWAKAEDVAAMKRDVIKNEYSASNGMHLLRIGVKEIGKPAEVTRVVNEFFVRCEQQESIGELCTMVSDQALYKEQHDRMQSLLSAHAGTPDSLK